MTETMRRQLLKFYPRLSPTGIERKTFMGPFYGGDAEWSWAGVPAFREQRNCYGAVNIRVIDEGLTEKIFDEIERARADDH